MTEGNSEDRLALEDLLHRLEESRQGLMDAIEGLDPELFSVEAGDTESIKRALERTADELNFYYGSLAARALSLPQPPCMQRAEFGSLREAAMSLQVAHRRFSNLLHDLIPADLERSAQDEGGAVYTLRQVLEMVSAQYNYRVQQIQRIAKQVSQSR